MALICSSGWLYDDNRPFDYLKQLSVFDELKRRAGEGYFEALIRDYLLENPHGADVMLKPRTGLAAEREQAEAEKLAAYKASLDRDELEALVRRTAELKEYQETEESPEALECIPLLRRKDITRKTPVSLHTEKQDADGTDVLYHDYFTNGIGYLTLLFQTEGVPDELISYMGILKSVLGYVSTEHYTYGQLFHEINASTGGISCGLQVFPGKEPEDAGTRLFGVRAKYLYPQQEFVFRMIREILLTSRLEDEKRLREIMSSLKARLQSALPAAGHSTAASRAMSY